MYLFTSTYVAELQIYLFIYEIKISEKHEKKKNTRKEAFVDWYVCNSIEMYLKAEEQKTIFWDDLPLNKQSSKIHGVNPEKC